MTALMLDTRRPACLSDSAIAEPRIDTADLDSLHYSSSPKVRLCCTWHHDADGRLSCRWRQISTNELSALSIEAQELAPDDGSSCPFRPETGVQVLHWIATATLLICAGLSSIMCFLG